MNWYINDLSLGGQFASPFAFRETLEPLMRLMNSRKDLQGRIFCSRDLSNRMVTAKHSLPQAVRAVNDAVFLALVLRWISKTGPFWDTDRMAHPDDLFYYEQEDVTNQGLGEACRRLTSNLPATSFSFVESDKARFAFGPLPIVHGLIEQPFGIYDVANIWSVADFPVPGAEAPQSWNEMLQLIAAKMPGLILSGAIAEQLAPRPFDPGAAERMLALLEILQKFVDETTEDGGWTPAGIDLYSRHCMRDRARISDSSKQEKDNFKNEMTFPDPQEQGARLFCPWHAKLNFGAQYRIHFEWPRPPGQRRIKVVYIGLKITRS